MLERGEGLVLAELVEESFGGVCMVLHGELGETKRTIPLLDEPDSCIDEGGRTVRVSEMGRGESHEEEELLFVLLKVAALQRTSDDQPSQRVSDQTDFADRLDLAVLPHPVSNLIVQSHSHLLDVPVRRLFVPR